MFAEELEIVFKNTAKMATPQQSTLLGGNNKLSFDSKEKV